MARQPTGSAYESPIGSGRWHGKFTIRDGRVSRRLVACHTREAAVRHAAFIAEQIDRLRSARRLEFVERLLDLATVADNRELDRVKRGVDAIVGRAFDRLPEDRGTSQETTFRAFAEQWTSGELRRHFPDYVALKRSVAEDVYRLRAHFYPVVGDIPLRSFTLGHAEMVMRSLPEGRTPGTRRHVAQLVSRVLKLAVYPARVLERTPIPPGFLPKASATKATAWLYPDEEAAWLADRRPPLILRLFCGFLAREGLRRTEAASLTWHNLDLEHGIIALDENKTNDARMWMLGPDVVEALRGWKRLTVANTDARSQVFAQMGTSIRVEHLAEVFRRYLRGVDGIRSILFDRTESRLPIRAHDLRATFVTLALAAGRTERWVADRTGHRSVTMINRYRRGARTALELKLGWLRPLDLSIPELA
jgi:integrase